MTKKFWLFFLIISVSYITVAQLNFHANLKQSKNTIVAEDSSNSYEDDEDTEFC